FRLVQARLRHVCGLYFLGLFSSFFLSLGVPEVPFWTRRRYCFFLCLSSDLGGVWLFRLHCRGAAFFVHGYVAPNVFFGGAALGRWPRIS
ncbi:MAG: hypothetical protein OIF54_04245, partial [Cohaesibacter sp.]|nr:hypothetical protein [Cohaesibacter sp.]